MSVSVSVATSWNKHFYLLKPGFVYYHGYVFLACHAIMHDRYLRDTTMSATWQSFCSWQLIRISRKHLSKHLNDVLWSRADQNAPISSALTPRFFFKWMTEKGKFPSVLLNRYTTESYRQCYSSITQDEESIWNGSITVVKNSYLPPLRVEQTIALKWTHMWHILGLQWTKKRMKGCYWTSRKHFFPTSLLYGE